MRSGQLLAILLAPIAFATAALAQSPLPADTSGVRGIVRAVDEATLSTDLGYPVATLPFREGQSFSAGDVLATFDCGDLEAALAASRARLEAEQLTYDNNVVLARSNAVGKFDVGISKSKLDQALADVDAFDIKLGRCTIRAPFAGRIAQLGVHAYEIPDRSQPLMQIVGLADFEIDLLVPATWLRWLKPGAPFRLSVEETGDEMPAEVSRIAAVVNSVSQTVKVIGRFTGDTSGVLPGMSGPAVFPVPNG